MSDTFNTDSTVLIGPQQGDTHTMKTASDVFRIAMLGWCLAASMLSPVTVMAVEFALVGPRAIGMGGAGVAVTTDALATY